MATHKIMLDIPTDKVKEFQTDMLAFFDREHPEIVQEIEVRRVLDDDLTEKILNAAKEFKEKR